MRSEDETGSTGGSAAELIVQAALYERFAEAAGDVLAPEYRKLAADLCRRAADLMDPRALPDAPAAARATSLKPRDLREAGRAWQTFLAIVTARRARLTDDGAELLGDLDPTVVLSAGVAVALGLLATVSEHRARAFLSDWGVRAAALAEEVAIDG